MNTNVIKICIQWTFLWFSIEDLSADLSVDYVKIIILHHIKMNTLITVKYASVLETVQCLIQMLNHIIIIIIWLFRTNRKNRIRCLYRRIIKSCFSENIRLKYWMSWFIRDCKFHFIWRWEQPRAKYLPLSLIRRN